MLNYVNYVYAAQKPHIHVVFLDIGMSMMPEVTATQRDSVSVLMDGNGYETNSNSMASKRSNRRRSSQFALLDHEDYGL